MEFNADEFGAESDEYENVPTNNTRGNEQQEYQILRGSLKDRNKQGKDSKKEGPLS
jgi:hypothetical protein